MKGLPSFKLQFDPAEIPGLAAAYLQDGKDDDEKALASGRRIALGAGTVENLKIIYTWKTRGRGITRLLRNRPAEIADALKLAVEAEEERSAIAVLCGLHGVNVPIASAIMTAIKPDRYTVIDFRVLQALGTDTPDRSVDFYLAYLGYCRNLVGQYGVSMRDLDRALWQWSKNAP